MKIIFQVLALILVGMVSLGPADTLIPRIKVTDQCETRISPDRAVLMIRVKNKAHSARATKELHQKYLDNVQQVLTRFNISETHMTVSGPFCSVDGETSSHLRILIRDLTHLPGLIRTLSAKPGIERTRLTWTHSNLDELIRKARTTALQHAKTKARSMSKALDACLGEVLLIEEAEYSKDTRSHESDRPSIRIIQQVEATFRLIPGRPTSGEKAPQN